LRGNRAFAVFEEARFEGRHCDLQVKWRIVWRGKGKPSIGRGLFYTFFDLTMSLHCMVSFLLLLAYQGIGY
jgi:hypothetical protein